DDLVTGQRTPAPVLGDEAEQPMLDLVPLAGPWWEVTHVQHQAQVVGDALQRHLPQAVPTTIATTPIGRDHQLARLRKARRAHLLPPAANAGCGELSRVVIDAYADPALIASEVVHSVGDCFAEFLVRKVMHLDLLGL